MKPDPMGMRLIWLGLGLVPSGCSSGGLATHQPPDAGVDRGADAATEPGDDAGAEAGVDAGAPWISLIGRSWTVAAGATNTYLCRTIQVDSDLYISAFRPLEPVGQYRDHLVVADSCSTTDDYRCG